jgi:tellurium resistance protein TerZ
MGNHKSKNKLKKLNTVNERSTFVPGQWFEINVNEINVGLGWDFSKRDTFDLDASVTGFDERNEPVESIYFRQLDGLDRSVHHFGDNLTGVGDGDDEVISIILNKVPARVISLAVTVNSYKSNSLIKAKSAFIRLFETHSKREIGKFILNKTKDCIGLLLGLLERNRQTGGWFFRVMCDPIEGNVITNSYKSLKVLLNGYLESFNSEMFNNKPRHPLPDEELFTPETWINIDTARVHVGLGWDILPGNVYDLDASIISFDSQVNELEVIYHKNTKSKDGNIIHLGDNRTGIGEGDDEVLTINLRNLPQNVASLAVIVNSFKGNSMVGLRSAFIRLFDDDKPIGCHVLGEGTETVGLLLGYFRRDVVNKSWLFQVMIYPLPGTEAPESIPQLKSILARYKIPS